jgi:hypothetical protein|tara:strand:+ start:3921 stop:4097 length:177 start_codon:yes stop_codon:yes gene_type:complete
MKTLKLNIDDKVYMLLKNLTSENFIIDGFLKRIIRCIDNGIEEYDMEFKFQKDQKRSK